jgi:hypothetical protein
MARNMALGDLELTRLAKPPPVTEGGTPERAEAIETSPMVDCASGGKKRTVDWYCLGIRKATRHVSRPPAPAIIRSRLRLLHSSGIAHTYHSVLGFSLMEYVKYSA